MPDCNETVIRLDHDAKIAQVWTPNRKIRSMMQRIGAQKLERQIDGQWWRVGFRVLSSGIRFGNRRPGACSERTEAQRAATARLAGL